MKAAVNALRRWALWLPLVAFVLVGVLASLLAPHSGGETNLSETLRPPSRTHWLGTDQLGRDQLSRMLFATRTSLVIVLFVISVSVLFGLVIGSMAGYFGGKLDRFTRWFVDFAMSIPTLILALSILGLGGGGTRNLILVLAVFGWVPYARLVRNVVTANKDALSVDASRALGASHLRILRHHLVPLAIRPSAVYASTDVGAVVLISATLSFLGLGVAPPTPEWGQMLVDARPYLGSAWWLVIPPGVAIGLVALGANLSAEHLSASTPSPRLLAPEGTRQLNLAVRESPPSKNLPVASSSRALLEVRDLCVDITDSSRATRVVTGVSYCLRPGETLGIVGDSGSGKTISSLAPWGLLGDNTMVRGSSRFRGVELVGASASTKRALLGSQVGVVFQDAQAALHPFRTIGSQLGDSLRAAIDVNVNQQVRKRRGLDLLGQVGLINPKMLWRQYPHELSGGMRQRVMIAMALAGEPSLLIADEPTSSLDVTTQAVIVELLAELAEQANLAVLFISHNLPVVAMLAPQVVVIEGGRAVEKVSSAQLLDRYLQQGLSYSPKRFGN